MKPESSLPHSQDLSIGPYPQSYQSSSYHHPISPGSILILYTNLRLRLTGGLFPFGFSTNNLHLFLFSPVRAIWPYNMISSDNSTYAFAKSTSYEAFVLQPLPIPCNFIFPRSLGPNFLLSILFTNTLSVYSSLNFGDQAAHPCRATGKVTVLYILIFTFLDSWREGRMFWTEL
jgi:hypothetical protein